jgi:hypothetical protein
LVSVKYRGAGLVKIFTDIGRNIGTPDCIPRQTVSDIGGNYESGNSRQIIPFI